MTLCLVSALPVLGQIKTWDGAHRVDEIEVTIVYFVPNDASPLPDWKDRVAYYAKRIEQFHRREFDGQSKLLTRLQDEPFRSTRSIDELRRGDANAIFFRTLREVDAKLGFGQGNRQAFPILLVLSEINWRPLDDFYRVKPTEEGGWMFEGNYNQGRHFPGAESGGARATFLTDRGIGWGLVSGDGWRVPYSGTDCVVYHEGVGHSIGLPHNEPADGAVMSLGQYNGWINQSWLDAGQKKRLGWIEPEKSKQGEDLFTIFTAVPEPAVPKPNTEVKLKVTWPDRARLKNHRLRIQTDLRGPWVDIASPVTESPPSQLSIGIFDRPTPVSYRLDVELDDGQREELWGYFQVREDENRFPVPPLPTPLSQIEKPTMGAVSHSAVVSGETIDLLASVDVAKQSVSGRWESDGRVLISPKAYGARFELPVKVPEDYEMPEEYEMVVIVEPLDEPNGLILGQKLLGKRFLALINYQASENHFVTALENIDGKNFNENPTTVEGPQLAKNRLSEIIVRVQKNSVTVGCDGRELIDWRGQANQLSLSDYWSTPNSDAIFIGAYDCRFRFHRVTLTPLTGRIEKR